MRKNAIRAAAVAVAAGFGFSLAGPADGAVLLSEVLYNESGGDAGGEWIEVMNTDQLLPFSVAGYGLGDEETSGSSSATEALYRFPAAASIPANDVVVVAVSATAFFAVYQFNPDFEFSATDPTVPDMILDPVWDADGGVVNMSNSNDQAVLVSPVTDTNAVIDAVNWGNTFALNPGVPDSEIDGQSYRRINFTDTDTASDWELTPADTTTPAAQRSSPGTLTAVPEPAALSLVGLAGGLALTRRRRR
jgi:hypothetical protein